MKHNIFLFSLFFKNSTSLTLSNPISLSIKRIPHFLTNKENCLVLSQINAEISRVLGKSPVLTMYSPRFAALQYL